MRVVRYRTLLAVAALVMVAGRVAAAAVTLGSPSGQNPESRPRAAVIQASNLFPTSATHPDPKVVSEAVLPLEAATPHRLAAQCDNCTPGSPEAAQFEALVVEVKSQGKVYRGPLQALDAVVQKSNEHVKVRVWLADTGKPQAQGVTSVWSFTAAPTSSD